MVVARGVPPGHHWANDALGALLERKRQDYRRHFWLLLLLPCLLFLLLARRANSQVLIRLCDTTLTHTATLAALPRRLSRGVLPSRGAARRVNSKIIIRLCDTIFTRTAALAALPRRLSRGVLPSREAASRPTEPERLSPVAARRLRATCVACAAGAFAGSQPMARRPRRRNTQACQIVAR